MKALIATGIGVLGLGGLFVASSGRSASAPAQPGTVTLNGNAAGVQAPTLVNCGEGRQAVFFPADSGFARVECVGREFTGTPFLPVADSGFRNGAQFADLQSAPATRTVVQERVVYRDRPVARPAAARRSSTSTYTKASASPASRADRQVRSRKRSALIIGGTTAAGAGVGALLGGKSGAAKGAVAGLLGSTVYDIATRNK